MAYKFDFIDLKSQQKRIRAQLDARIARVLDHGQYIMGPEISECEAELTKFSKAKHSILCSNGTDALLLAMMALDIGPGDEVITSPFTFFATGEMVAFLKATPVFCDIDPKTYNLDPSALEAKITKKTKAIVPVNLYGQCADYEAIHKIARAHGVPVIEDAAQSFGASYKNIRSGAIAELACTSFFPAKPLGTYGDGGAVFTNNDEWAKKMRSFLNHGQESRYYHTRIGLNARCDTLHAAILLAKLEIFEDELKARDLVASRYSERINKLCGDSIMTPFVAKENFSAWAQYTIQVTNRDQVAKRLNEQGVPTSVHYPRPLHLQPAFAYLNLKEGAYPNAEKAAQGVLSLPMHPYLSASDQDYICEALKKAL